jgi:aspartyl-tRNA(Asn)/glutamyl-tRNA(Gln) amidotransferase subunit B
MEYDIVICFEIHVELKTATKLFCDCPVEFGADPNSHICPVCTGQPGALPVLNKKAVEYCIRAGLAMNCSINKRTRFARKNYFYPDLPKGYQISQYELPFCEDGYLEIANNNDHPYAVGIKRIHLEEDAGKLLHSSEAFDEADHSLVDYNRCSIPLLEIVGDHERNPLQSVQQAHVYLKKVRQILRYTEISDCSIEKGQFRCDVNISLRPKGVKSFGNRTEIKNMSSFKFILDALKYEIKRQAEILESGGEILQETRLFDEEKKITLPMRSKEDAPDYRYFPDPDLVEVEFSSVFINNIMRSLPELPDQRVKQLIEKYDIRLNDALILTKDRNVSDYFDDSVFFCQDYKKLARWIVKDLFKLLNVSSLSIRKCPITPQHFAQLINLITAGEITEKIGRIVLENMFKTGNNPEAIIKDKGLKPIQDDRVLEKILNEIISQNPQVVAQIKDGKTKLIDFLIGQVMKETTGKANPRKVNELIQKKLVT